MMKKVVITGSSGRIGRALHWKLCRDYEVIGLDVLPSPATSQIMDIRDYEQLLRSFEGVDTVFHSAALHAPHVGIASEKAFYDINVAATLYLNGLLHLISVLALLSVKVFKNATNAAFSELVKFSRTGFPLVSVKAGESVGWA